MSNDSAEIVSKVSSNSKPEQGEKVRSSCIPDLAGCNADNIASVKDRVASGLAAKLYYCQWD